MNTRRSPSPYLSVRRACSRAGLSTLVSAVLGAAVVAAPAVADAALAEKMSETFRGGVVADSWGGVSTETTFASGNLIVRLPKGATVRKAYLVSAVTQYDGNPVQPSSDPGSPRIVVLDNAAAPTTVLEGANYVTGTDPSYRTFVTDVTAAIQAKIPVAPGGDVLVPVKERGDETVSTDTAAGMPMITGHTLVVAYDLPSAPLRNVGIYLGAVSSNERGVVNFAKPVANICTQASGFAEKFPLSASVAWEKDWELTQAPTVGVNKIVLYPAPGATVAAPGAGSTTLTSQAGGSDDGSDDRGDVISQVYTGGSFGADDRGRPVELKGDMLNGNGSNGRPDDELYDIAIPVLDKATSVEYAFLNNDNNQALTALVFQTTARQLVGDADGDGVPDAVEAAAGNCVDTDGDLVPDYLDLDSDNDCIPDATDPARLVAATAAVACTTAVAPFCSLQGSVGICTGCDADFGAAVGESKCPTAAAPFCLTQGPSAGSCSPKAKNNQPTLNGEVCQATPPSTLGKATSCESGVCSTVDGRCGYPNGVTPLDPAGAVSTDPKYCRSNVVNADGKCGDPNSIACTSPTAPGGVINECRSDICFSATTPANVADNLCGLPNKEPCSLNGTCRTVCVASDLHCGLINGTPCTAASECRANVCFTDKACGLPNGEDPAGDPTKCRSGAVDAAGKCTSACTTDTNCGGGNYCDIGSGTCVPSEPNGSKTGPTGSKTVDCVPARASRQCVTAICNADGKCGDPDGSPCASATTCRTGLCTDGKCGNACTTDANCKSGNYCENTSKTCIPSEPNGSKTGPTDNKNTDCDPARQTSQCASGICAVDGRCGKPDGETCSADAVCRNGACNLGICGSACKPGGAGGDAECAPAYWCSGAAADAAGKCTPDVPNGQKPGGTNCNRGNQCVSDICFSDGLCGRPDGQPCTAAGQCRTAVCIGGTCGGTSGCTSDANCTADKFCKNPGANGTCTPKLPNGDPCTSGNVCISNACHSDGKCGLPDGDPCGASALCRSGVCNAQSQKCGACKTDSECGSASSGIVCSAGACIPGCRGTGGNTCANGAKCSSTTDAVGTCQKECAADTDCLTSQFCNTAATPKICSDKRPDGESCSAANQCVTGACTNGACGDGSTANLSVEGGGFSLGCSVGEAVGTVSVPFGAFGGFLALLGLRRRKRA